MRGHIEDTVFMLFWVFQMFNLLILLRSVWLGEEDSNLYRRLQRPLSCRWTIPQKVRLWFLLINESAQDPGSLKINYPPSINH